ncbi:AbrB/MazE/SpoVT family DNA-binding domain-containing protein [Thermodesulfobacteriota bacterium]
MGFAAKITSKGQVTIPKKIRDHLDSEIVEFEINNNAVVVRPVKSVGGSLSRFAKSKKPLKKIRDQIWKEVADERGKDTSS